jgi:hypothetical protein
VLRQQFVEREARQRRISGGQRRIAGQRCVYLFQRIEQAGPAGRRGHKSIRTQSSRLESRQRGAHQPPKLEL